MELTKKILNLNEGLTIYGQLLKDEEAILIPFTMSQYATVHTIVELLREYLADLERNECKEALCIDFDQMTSVDYWMEKLVKLRSDMERLGSVPLKEHGFVVTILGFTPQTTMDFYRAIEQKIVQMTEMLREVYRKLQENPSLFAAFYRFQKAACDARPVKARYRRWKREVGVVTPELLKDKEVYEIEKYLKMKILRHTLAPSDREVEQVDLGKMNRHLPYGYVIPEDLKKCYARFLRYVKEDGDTLRIDHHLYGNYLFQHFNDLTPAERQAFIELDLMLELIHEDMRNLPTAEPDTAPARDHTDPQRGGELEERIRQCIALLMDERYCDEELLFNIQGHWQAVYRILVDKGYCRDSDFNGFDAFIQEVMPEKVNKPYKRDSVRNINKTDFNKPFDKWKYNAETSGKRIPYDRMVAVASRFKAILEENGL